ncbi:MAG TPA: hypothetical protein ENO20_15015 [Bacteroides sp.]|nr:hypothetical protein [Bacteroides sp.]
MRKTAILFGCLLLIACKGVAQHDTLPSFRDTLAVYEGLFTETEPLHLTLKFDLKNFQRTRRQEKYQPAQMTCHMCDSFSVTHPVRVKARGNFRRDNCTLPPFWLNIRHSGIEAPALEGLKRMKMVVRCRHSPEYEAYVLREYLVYRIYQIVSPYSFRVRLVRLRLVDTGRKDRVTEDWAFLIEPEALLARRLGGQVVKSDRLAMATVNREVMDLLAMFNYMIGNCDYSVTGRQNLKIIALDGPGPSGFIPVPYDFDYTGLVNTHYAVPGEALGIKTVRERYYLGLCGSRERHLSVIRELESYREKISRLILDFEYLDDMEKMDMVAFIQSYFNAAQKEKFIDREIMSTCR